MQGNCTAVSHPLLQAGLFCSGILPVGYVSADGQGFLQRRLAVQGGVAHVLIDGVDGHLRYVFCSFGLDVQRDQAVCYQVVDGLEALLSHKMLSIVKQTEVSGLIPKAERERKRKRVCVEFECCNTAVRRSTEKWDTDTHTEHLWMYQLPVLWFVVVMNLESNKLICWSIWRPDTLPLTPPHHHTHTHTERES